MKDWRHAGAGKQCLKLPCHEAGSKFDTHEQCNIFTPKFPLFNFVQSRSTLTLKLDSLISKMGYQVFKATTGNFLSYFTVKLVHRKNFFSNEWIKDSRKRKQRKSTLFKEFTSICKCWVLKRVRALKLPERETLEPGVIMEGFNEEVKLIFLFDYWVEIEYDKKDVPDESRGRKCNVCYRDNKRNS